MTKLLFASLALLPALATPALAQGSRAPSPQPSSYICPKTATLNCMPIVPEERRALCRKDFLDWAAKNCPGLQVVY